jgi:hypothetical protein
MTGPTLEQLRLPAAVLLVAIALLIFLPRMGSDPTTAGATATPMSSIVAGQPGGAVTSTETPEPSTAPTATVASTMTPTPEATPSATASATREPVAADGFGADLFACDSISGSACNGQFGRMPAGDGSLVALVVFENATAGDQINVTLSGPGGTVAGAPYALGGSGDGYYYSNFSIPGWPGGSYTLVANRNGAEVARTSFARGG